MPVSSLSHIFERTLPLLILLGAIVGVPVLVLSKEGLPRLRALQEEKARVQAENDAIRAQIRRLRIRAERLRKDEAAVEPVARGQLGLIRNNEVVFQFRPAR